MINEIMNAVIFIQEDITKSSGVKYLNIQLISNGYSHKVCFEGIELWNSDDDCRIYYERTDDYETIEDCLRRRMREELNIVRDIRI